MRPDRTAVCAVVLRGRCGSPAVYPKRRRFTGAYGPRDGGNAPERTAHATVRNSRGSGAFKRVMGRRDSKGSMPSRFSRRAAALVVVASAVAAPVVAHAEASGSASVAQSATTHATTHLAAGTLDVRATRLSPTTIRVTMTLHARVLKDIAVHVQVPNCHRARTSAGIRSVVLTNSARSRPRCRPSPARRSPDPRP
jgi:hypothetical protein